MSKSRPDASPLDRLFADLPPQLSLEQTAEVLGRHVRTVQKWVREGSVPAYRIAGTWLVLRDELKDWVLAGSNRNPANRTEATEDPAPRGAGDDLLE